MITVMAELLITLAYVGPGLGAGVVATVLGVIGAFFLGLFAILFYPIKRMLKKRKAAKQGAEEAVTVETTATPEAAASEETK